MTDDNPPDLEKVVIQFGSKTIKGYVELPRWNTLEELLSNLHRGAFRRFTIRRVDSDVTEEISMDGAKAIFYVNSFEGNSDHTDLSFYSRALIPAGIWMRIRFLDGEVMEGIVYNSIDYLVDPGFFLIPTDPGSNNKLVYVAKCWLAEHHVLGLRKI